MFRSKVSKFWTQEGKYRDKFVRKIRKTNLIKNLLFLSNGSNSSVYSIAHGQKNRESENVPGDFRDLLGLFLESFRACSGFFLEMS